MIDSPIVRICHDAYILSHTNHYLRINFSVKILPENTIKIWCKGTDTPDTLDIEIVKGIY